MSATLRFATGKGSFGLPVAHVRRIAPAAELGPLPDATEGVIGAVLEDGVLIPVLGVLGTTGRLIVVIEFDGVRAGVLVDEVTGVVPEATTQAAPAPAGQATALVSGTVTVGRETTMLLDPGVLLAKVAA